MGRDPGVIVAKSGALVIAGIGCRRDCPADAIVALVQQAGGAGLLAAPEWKRDEPGLLEAARRLALPLRLVEDAALAAAQPRCPTRSAVAKRVTGHASVAEAAALAGGGVLIRPRMANAWATCAIAVE